MQIKTRISTAALALSFALFSAAALCAGEEAGKSYKRSEMRVRDPFVFADKKTNFYYMHANDNSQGLKVYRSKDLENWEFLGRSFTPDSDFWGKADFWAPDMFERDGKYYVIATFSRKEKNIRTPNGTHALRGSSVLVSDKPEGPYKPLANAPITPENWMCLDATLFEEDGKLYILYCHEWIQVCDGEIIAQEISKDLKKTIGEPRLLFKASAAPWGKKNQKSMVTDAPVINRAEDGTLYMTWSTFGSDGKYHIGFAVSSNGKLFGEWKQSEHPLNNDDGGHAMVFKTFDGKTKISYHAPNSKYPERPTIKDFSVRGGKATIE